MDTVEKSVGSRVGEDKFVSELDSVEKSVGILVDSPEDKAVKSVGSLVGEEIPEGWVDNVDTVLNMVGDLAGELPEVDVELDSDVDPLPENSSDVPEDTDIVLNPSLGPKVDTGPDEGTVKVAEGESDAENVGVELTGGLVEETGKVGVDEMLTVERFGVWLSLVTLLPPEPLGKELDSPVVDSVDDSDAVGVPLRSLLVSLDESGRLTVTVVDDNDDDGDGNDDDDDDDEEEDD